MSDLHVDCPHCGSSFEVQFDGEPSSMMVFACARCKTPLMSFKGVTSELDKAEFDGLRKKLTRIFSAAVKQEGPVGDACNSLKQLVDESNARAYARESSQATPLTDEALENLKKSLDEMDVDSFLDSL